MCAAIAALVTAGAVASSYAQSAGTTALPHHFGIGLSAGPNDNGIYGWMPDSKIPWDYAYTYLAGGVNTGYGWETWNAGAKYPLYYAQGAASHHYIPVFPYYEMLQSSGTCNTCSEPKRDLSNLNNPAVMKAYFANFALLMQRLGNGPAAFKGTAIVQIEPDLSGYAQGAVLDNAGSCYGFCTHQGNAPSFLNAAVARSGYPGLGTFPNTYQGFNWALLHLRDLYAPNVLLAFHVSNWATRQDVGSSRDASLKVAALGKEAGFFAARSGTQFVPANTSTYDLLFNDVSDRDAGYYKNVYGSDVWWDRLNVKLPNFHRWETYIKAVSTAAARKVMVWQIPEGNQYFRTENNTDGHYQDNRAEYFFNHIPELIESGVIGLLFGAGNGGSTVHYDGKVDKVTNPPAFCTSDGTSGARICNTHVSTLPDDDGGYLRMQGQAYYAHGAIPLP